MENKIEPLNELNKAFAAVESHNLKMGSWVGSFSNEKYIIENDGDCVRIKLIEVKGEQNAKDSCK